MLPTNQIMSLMFANTDELLKMSERICGDIRREVFAKTFANNKYVIDIKKKCHHAADLLKHIEILEFKYNAYKIFDPKKQIDIYLAPLKESYRLTLIKLNDIIDYMHENMLLEPNNDLRTELNCYESYISTQYEYIMPLLLYTIDTYDHLYLLEQGHENQKMSVMLLKEYEIKKHEYDTNGIQKKKRTQDDRHLQDINFLLFSSREYYKLYILQYEEAKKLYEKNKAMVIKQGSKREMIEILPFGIYE